MWNNVRGNTSWSNLCHARVSEPFELLCTTHRGRKISQYYYAVHKIIRRFRKYTCKHVRATRKRPNVRRFLKRDCVSITLRSWNAAIVSLDPIPFCCHTKHVRNASWGNGDYVLVYHDLFTVVYFLFVPAFKFHRPYLEKDTYFSCYC